MHYKQSFAANSFLAGMKFAVHVYLLFCIYELFDVSYWPVRIKHS